MRTDGHRGQKIERTTEGMGQRQKRQTAASLVMQLRLHAEHHIPAQVIARQHHPLGKSGSTRGVIQLDDFIIIQPGILHVVLGKTGGIGIPEMSIDIRQVLCDVLSVPLAEATVIGERQDSAQLRQLLLFEVFPDVIPGEEHHCLRMVDDMLHIVRVKIL